MTNDPGENQTQEDLEKMIQEARRLTELSIALAARKAVERQMREHEARKEAAARERAEEARRHGR